MDMGGFIFWARLQGSQDVFPGLGLWAEGWRSHVARIRKSENQGYFILVSLL